MAEFAPAAGFRATQGMAAALSPPRGLRVSFSLPTILLDKQEKVGRQRRRRCRKLLILETKQQELDPRLRGDDNDTRLNARFAGIA